MRCLTCAVLVLLLCLACACAGADSVSFGAVTADTGDRYVDLQDQVIRNWDAFYEFLDSFPELEKVDMFATRITRQRIEEIHARYPDVEFGMTMSFGEHTVRTDVTAFSTLHDSDSGWHSNQELALLRFCPNLYALDIGHNSITDLSFLYEMPQLRVLIVAIAKITDLTPIASLEHLEYLEVFYNQVTDISPLVSLTRLMDLNISYNFIEDVTPLMGMTSLRRLWMHECNRRHPREPGEELQAELMRALPDCHIDFTSTSTGGGWREDPHFDVIYRMFRSRVYEPFADSDPANIPEGF